MKKLNGFRREGRASALSHALKHLSANTLQPEAWFNVRATRTRGLDVLYVDRKYRPPDFDEYMFITFSYLARWANDKDSAASTMEMIAVIKTVRWGASACMAALALALTCGVASAQQQKAPEAVKTAPAKKAPAAAAKKAAAPAAKKSAAPACNALKEEAACATGPGCQWIAASKTKAGKEIKAYCRSAPKAKAPAAKAPAKAAAPKAPAKAAAPTTAAPKAPAKKN